MLKLHEVRAALRAHINAIQWPDDIPGSAPPEVVVDRNLVGDEGGVSFCIEHRQPSSATPPPPAKDGQSMAKELAADVLAGAGRTPLQGIIRLEVRPRATDRPAAALEADWILQAASDAIGGRTVGGGVCSKYADRPERAAQKHGRRPRQEVPARSRIQVRRGHGRQGQPHAPTACPHRRCTQSRRWRMSKSIWRSGFQCQNCGVDLIDCETTDMLCGDCMYEEDLHAKSDSFAEFGVSPNHSAQAATDPRPARA